MRTYLVGYDLNRPRGANDYPNLINAIKGIGDGWWHCLDSTWIIKTNLSAVQIRDTLKVHIDGGDELLVVRLSGEGAWGGFDQQCSDWLMTYLSYE
jgi:hypothetical protein